MSNDKQQKWEACYQHADISSATPAQVLTQNTHLLPPTGRALDLACGRAGNAQFLAKRGFQVDAFDYSSSVIQALTDFNAKAIHPKVWHSEKDSLAEQHYHIIIVSYFLQRDLFPSLINALKTGGLLFYQTWSQQCIDQSGPRNPDFRLQQGELLSLCAKMRIMFYREEGAQGNPQQGVRNQAWVIAEKA